MPPDFFVSAFVTLFVVVDPLGLIPAFLAATEKVPAAARRSIAFNACIIAGLILAGFALAGDWLLWALGITLPAFHIAGGLLLFIVAFDMVLGWRVPRETDTAEQALEERARHVAAFPLATPLMAGPGAITATILLAGQTQGQPIGLAILLAVIALVIGGCLAAFVFASVIRRWIGAMGSMVLSRLLGIILAALAVQYVIDGTRSAFGL
ncbi:MAG: MarC family protein [Bradyrhizobiaceae bacterium]|nr:MarC family protein [Bradyrhizobiaceae bacterium]